MSTKEQIAINRKIRERCILPEVFKGWTSETTYAAIGSAFFRDPEWMRLHVLHPRLRKIHFDPDKHWSSGYCYNIVDAATLIFEAVLQPYKRMVCEGKKKTIGRLGNHHVLLIGQQVFDPEKGATQPMSDYVGFRASHKMPISPSSSTLSLFMRIIEVSRERGLFDAKQKTIIDSFEQDVAKLQIELCRPRRGL